MGKRKKSTVKVQKRFYRLPKHFPCPICNAKDSVYITINKDHKKADLICKKCGEGVSNQPIKPIMEAVDVYDDWCDSLREQNKNFNYNAEEATQALMEVEDEEIINEPSRLHSNATSSTKKNTQNEDDSASGSESSSASSSSDSGDLSSESE